MNAFAEVFGKWVKDCGLPEMKGNIGSKCPLFWANYFTLCLQTVFFKGFGVFVEAESWHCETLLWAVGGKWEINNLCLLFHRAVTWLMLYRIQTCDKVETQYFLCGLWSSELWLHITTKKFTIYSLTNIKTSNHTFHDRWSCSRAKQRRRKLIQNRECSHF